MNDTQAAFNKRNNTLSPPGRHKGLEVSKDQKNVSGGESRHSVTVCPLAENPKSQT